MDEVWRHLLVDGGALRVSVDQAAQVADQAAELFG